MSLYAVKNDEGKWLSCDIYCDEPDWFDHNGFIWDTRSIAEENVELYGGHVSELVEAPANVVVSEDEAEVLKKAKNTTVWRPAAVISSYAYDNTKDPDDEVLLEDRLMRAYVNGWKVEKPKRWYVKAPHTDEFYYFKPTDGSPLRPCGKRELSSPSNDNDEDKFTLAEIDHYGLQDCERIEVTDHD